MRRTWLNGCLLWNCWDAENRIGDNGAKKLADALPLNEGLEILVLERECIICTAVPLVFVDQFICTLPFNKQEIGSEKAVRCGLLKLWR